MFLLKLSIGEGSFELLKKFAAKSGVSLENAAWGIFNTGLQTLAQGRRSAKQAYGRVPRRPRAEIEAYIREYWQRETDEEMGRALGYVAPYIQVIRSQMGIVRTRSRRYCRRGPARPGSAVFERRERLKALIKEHGATKSDAEIGRLMEPPYATRTVTLVRCSLGILKQRGWGSRAQRGVVADSIDREEFERMVAREGYTMTEYLRLKNLLCTRQRLEQVAVALELKHTPEDRAPEWQFHRRARKLNKPELANREWLAERLTNATSVAALAAELEVGAVDLFFFIRGLGLAHPSLRKHGVITVDLVCEHCGTPFKRLKQFVDRAIAKAGDKPVKFYCNMKCAGTALGLSRKVV